MKNMQKNRIPKRVMAISIGMLLLAVTSCLDSGDYGLKKTEIIEIIDYAIPDTVSVSDTVQIQAIAKVENTCWGDFEFVFNEVSDTSFSLTAYATYDDRGQTCETKEIIE